MLANLFRADVRDEGYGTGYYGFECVLRGPGTVDVGRALDRIPLPLADAAARSAA